MFRSTKTRRPLRSKLAVTEFDARIVPAVLLTQLNLDGDAVADDIRIIGDAQNSKIAVVDNGANQVHVQIDANGDGDYGDAKLGDLDAFFNFTGDSFVLDAQLKAGKDTLSYLSTGVMNNSARSVSADMGAGNDTFTWIQNNAVTGVSHISLDVFGGLGNDTFLVDFGKIDHSVVNVNANLGSGNDIYNLIVEEVEQQASMTIETDLGAGLNTHNADIDAVGKFTYATLDMAITGGANKDVVTVRVRDDIGGGVAQPSSHLAVIVDLLAGHDVFTGQLDGGDFRVDDDSQASFVVRGGAGNDTLKMERLGSGVLRVDAGGLFLMDLDGGAGNDTVAADFGGVDAWQLETPTSRVKIRLDGGFGNDILSCLITNDATTNGDFDIALRGGYGNDTLTFATNNNGGTPTYGPAGGVLLDGGLGIDTLVNGNPSVTLGTGFETVI